MARPRPPHDPDSRRRGGPTRTTAVVTLVALAALAAGVAGASRLAGHEPTPAAGHPVPARPDIDPPAARTAERTPARQPAPAGIAGGPHPARGSGANPASRPVGPIAANPLNTPDLGVPAVPCSLPPFDPSPQGQDAFYQAELVCLNNAWGPVLRAAGIPFHPPRVSTVTTDVRTPCGKRDAMQTSLYCDGVIHMTARYYSEYEGHGHDAGVYLGQLAHEYGHHVQQLAGIMQDSWRQRRAAGPHNPVTYDRSRRIELQTTCYDGMFLTGVVGRGAVDQQMVNAAIRDAGERGDYGDGRPPDHGTPRVNADWIRRGYEHNRTAKCNTWLADPAAVG